MTRSRVGATVGRLTIAACWTYFTFLFAWTAMYLATGQSIWFMALLDGAVLIMFLPVPIVLVLGVALRRRDVLAGSGVAILIAAWLWGWLFLPRPPAVQASTETLSVMTYNLYGPALQTTNVIDVIRSEHPDVVVFQELNRANATALQTQLANEYPYQVLGQIDGVKGMGTISKFPLRDTGERLPHRWVGQPQLLTLEWSGQTIALLNFHMPTPPLGPSQHGVREADAEAIVAYARAAERHGPVIAAGDTNVTHLSDPYRTITGVLKDSWGEAGYGLGLTWGGKVISSGLGLDFPIWLVRIDYVFHSHHLRAVDARVAKFDGASDHRGVVVTLTGADPTSMVPRQGPSS